MDGIEREIKLAVPSGFAMPRLDRLAGTRAETAIQHQLDAVYWDSDDLALERQHCGLRHRNGVWTFKGPAAHQGAAVVREEVELSGPPEQMPPAIAERVARLVTVASLRPVVRVSNLRTVVVVHRGQESVEVCHDRVAVHHGEGIALRYTEVELEHGDDSAPLAADLVHLLARHGATPSHAGKYRRALEAVGLLRPEGSGPGCAGPQD